MKRFESIFYLIVVAGLIIRYASDGGDFDRKGNGGLPVAQGEARDPLQKGSSGLERDMIGDVHVEVEATPKSGTGTAFAVAEGRWITARHVVNQCNRIYLQFPGKKFFKAAGANQNRSADMAVINTPGFSRAAFSYANSAPTRGDMGYFIGYPQGMPGDIAAQMIGLKRMKTSGAYFAREKVMAWAERERRPIFTGSAGGISGGPAFDKAGRVTGIVVAGAPRRGRIYTTHPDTLRAEKLAREGDGEGMVLKGGFNSNRFNRTGDGLRKSGRVAKVLCLV